MSSTIAPVWFKFFLEAGIPPSDAGNYAVTFTENRIQPDMMTDLTKEYLAEMGISVLGDVIAILKHARVVHTQAAREKALQCTGLAYEIPDKISKSADNVAAVEQSSKLIQKQTLAAIPQQKTASKPVASTTKATVNATKPITLEKTPTAVLSSSQPKKTNSQSAKVTPVAKTSERSTLKLSATANGSSSQLPKASTDTMHMPLMSRLEGTLKRLSATDLSKKEMERGSGVGKTSVFSRLGCEVAVSDAVITKPSAEKTTFKVTVNSMGSDSLVTTKADQSKSASIFNRLGSKTNVAASSSVKGADASTAKHPVLVKTGKNLKDRLGPPTSSATASSVSSASEGILGREDSVSSVAPAKLRLGVKRPAPTAALQSPTEPKVVKKDIKTRLGLPNNTSNQASAVSRPVAIAKPRLQDPVSRPKASGVFGRLGTLN